MRELVRRRRAAVTVGLLVAVLICGGLALGAEVELFGVKIKGVQDNARPLLVVVALVLAGVGLVVWAERWPGPDVDMPHPAEDLDEFIPRPETVEIEDALRRSRVVALTGPSGAGKSRLARELTRTRIRQPTAGEERPWFVDLSGVTEDYAAGWIARGLPSGRDSDTNSQQVLADWFGRRRSLVVLDNGDDAPVEVRRVVGHLIDECPNLRIITTSQADLDLGATRVGVRGLRFPDRTPANAEAAQEFEAIRLFVRYADQECDSPVLTDDTVGMVTDVCRAVSGLPAALKAAAALLTELSLKELLLRLQAGGGLPEMKTVLELVYRRLGDRERRLFRRLWVIQGPFRATIAVRACAGNESADEVLGALRVLLQRHVVEEAIDDPTGVNPRLPRQYKYLRMYEAHRAYGRALLLLEEGDDAQTRIRAWHAEAFTALAESEAPSLTSRARASALLDLSVSARDFESALQYADVSDRRLLARLCSSLFWYWNFRGELREAQRWLERALRGADDLDPVTLARLRYGRGGIAFLQGDLDRAKSELTDSVTAWHGYPDHVREAGLALVLLSTAELERGELKESEQHADEAVRLLDAHEDDWPLALALNDLGNRRAATGHWSAAADCYERALQLWLMLEDRWGEALTRGNLGSLVWRQHGEVEGADTYAVAERHLQRALAIQTEDGDLWGEGWSQRALGELALCRGRLEEAERAFHASLQLNARVGRVQVVADCISGLARVAGHRGDLLRAVTLLAGAERVRELRFVRQWPVEAELHVRAWDALVTQLQEQVVKVERDRGRALVVDTPRFDVMLGRLLAFATTAPDARGTV